MHKETTVFSTIFLLFVILLVTLPFLTAFQDVLTRLVMRFALYKALQDYIVPYEIRIIASLLIILHVPIKAGSTYIQFLQQGKYGTINLIWNCVGWQSFVLFLLTLLTGLSGKFSLISKFEAFTIGLL